MRVKVVDPPTGITIAPKALVTFGGAITRMLAEAVLPIPALVEVTLELTLFFVPAVVLVTLTEIMQEPPIATVPPDRMMELEPSAAVAVPPHVLLKAPGVATTKPAGRLSVKPTPFKTNVLGLMMVKVKLVVPFNGIVDAAKALLMVGGRKGITRSTS